MHASARPRLMGEESIASGSECQQVRELMATGMKETWKALESLPLEMESGSSSSGVSVAAEFQRFSGALLVATETRRCSRDKREGSKDFNKLDASMAQEEDQEEREDWVQRERAVGGEDEIGGRMPGIEATGMGKGEEGTGLALTSSRSRSWNMGG
jgi:hypothetical protein